MFGDTSQDAYHVDVRSLGAIRQRSHCRSMRQVKGFYSFHDEWFISCELQVVYDTCDCFLMQCFRFFRESWALVNCE
jgi:hypothetical protein